jgi:predicted TIM-barrel fold metal-dependent hydrolase
MPLLPDPEPREKKYRVISVDDHLCEPPDIFEGRLPARLRPDAPRVERLDDGTEVWVMEGEKLPNIGLNAVAGRPKDEWNFEPSRFDEMRKGAWNIDARVADMDIAGIDVSLCFPSLIAGFSGTRFSRMKNQELGLACVQAWNDWMIDVWCGSYPGRQIAQQVTWLADPTIAADMIYENAGRGFKSVSLPEGPVTPFPNLRSGYWDPILRACEETDTVISLHTGTGEWQSTMSPDAPVEQRTVMFPACGLASALEWLWSLVPVRFPNIKIAMSEGGIGWVPMVLDRTEFMMKYEMNTSGTWQADISPNEALQRNFWFCTLDDPSTLPLIERIGEDHIMLEVDYPHASTTWPDTQTFITNQMEGKLTPEQIEKVTWKTASELYRHPLPT